MLQCFYEFIESFNVNYIQIANYKFDKIIRNYSFLPISEQLSDNQNQEICRNINESNIIIINHSNAINSVIDDGFFVIGFKQTIIFIEQAKLSHLGNLFTSKQDLNICFLSNSKDVFNQYIKIKYIECEFTPKFNEEIFNFNKQLFLKQSLKLTLKNIWELIQPCISGFLIKQSYLKAGIDRLNNYFSNEFQIDEMNENDYINLRMIKMGTIFITELIYHIDREELFIIKKPNTLFEVSNFDKQRIERYLQLSHPFMPHFYGTIKDTNFLLFEFIHGENMKKIRKLRLNDKERIRIIFEVLIVIEYLHHFRLNLHELNPENIVVDHNKTAVLVNFDAIMNNEEDEARNLSQAKIVYSLGNMMYFVMNQNSVNQSDFMKISKIDQMYKECVKINENERPTITRLIEEIYNVYSSKYELEDLYSIHTKSGNFNETTTENEHSKSDFDINESINFYLQNSMQNDPTAQFNLGAIYFENKFVPRDIKKAIHYFSIASNLNEVRSQFNLGLIFSSGEFVQPDVKKAVYYFSLAANQNDERAQMNLGSLYIDGELLQKDVKKAIYYFSLAAARNNPQAQFRLGLIFSEGKDVKKDVKKAVYYYTLAANQGVVEAQFNLGFIYSEGEDGQMDINKAIYYYTLASRQNDIRAQFNLGVIYAEGRFVRRDMGKAIYFYSLAAKQGVVEAQFNLGFIYSEKKEVDKAILYYAMAAEQNDPRAQFNLGVIYSEGRYIEKDISKAIKYYSLAAEQIPEAAFNLKLLSQENQYD